MSTCYNQYMGGKLVVGGVDLGNVLDIPKRVLDYFDIADLVVCEWEEDFLEKCKKTNRYPKNGYLSWVGQQNDSNEKINNIISLLEDNKTVLLIVGDGMPVICDPGREIILAAQQKNIPITIIPGPSIVPSALAVSGFWAEKFVFEGDIPEEKEERLKVFSQYRRNPKPVVFLAIRHTEAKMFKNGIKDNSFLMKSLIDMKDVIGKNRNICLCFNLTRENEFIFNGTIQDAIDWYEKSNFVGLLSIVIDGCPEDQLNKP